ncbi:hypothetical protein L873DRAFT_1826065 [Choiromyces venosus 120613-1]|uniref:Uncharacterized protein n=1 Tax=Choiromyces venosus 120613-1 TaxID=1336337 RepID=A0A3N4K395_9PEZI|nr:hypothetical protein L873DRAFT_1826065 [Choiromyces venosus 120613-1]
MTPPSFPSSMPGGSFLPSIPNSLPAYPKTVPTHAFRHSNQSPSPTFGPTRKRFQRDAGFSAQSPPPFEDAGDSDEDVMRNSLYSDSAYRSTLATSNSRKRGLADDDVDDYEHRPGARGGDGAGDNDRPAKRRIIDVVGSVASRVWEFCKARVPIYGPTPRMTAAEVDRNADEHLYDPGMPGHLMNGTQFGTGLCDNQQFMASSPPRPANAGMGMMDTEERNYFSSSRDFSPNKQVDGGLSSRWVMVSPAPTASTAPQQHNNKPSFPASASSSRTGTPTHPRRPQSSASSKRTSRPIIAASTRKRTTVVRPSHQRSRSSSTVTSSTFAPPPPQSAFTFHSSPISGGASMANTRGGRRKGRIPGLTTTPSMDDDEEDESMRRFNERLRDMIREGREALGSKVEVVYDEDDDLENF